MNGNISAGLRRLTRICKTSFFNGRLTRRSRRRKLAAFTAATLIFVSVALSSQLSYAVYINGEEVGRVGSRAEAITAVKGAEDQLAEILGYRYSLNESVSVGANLAAERADIMSLETALIESTGQVTELYALAVDGTVVGACEDYGALSRLLWNILNEYRTEDTLSVRFLNEVSLEKKYVSQDIVTDLDAIREAVAPVSGTAPLVVESIEKIQRVEDIPYAVQEQDDGTIYRGDSLVLVPGEMGHRLVAENAVLINGTERSRALSYSVTQDEPVAEVIAIGTAERPATASYGSYIWPADGVLTSRFGYRETTVGSKNHTGIDIGGSLGQSITAADGGEVIFADSYSGFGKLVQVKHDNGDVTYYGHLSKILVSVGERVYRGQELGKMGRTGTATGVHLHFELRKNGEPVNPINYLP